MSNTPILMYHTVPPARGINESDLAVAAPDLEAQVAHLKAKGYEAVLPRELMAALDGQATLPARAVVFTFDDALQSVHDHALPILQKAGYRAAVYVVAGQIGGHNAWDDGKGLPYEACMGEAALKRVLAAGWEIGSHGVTHSSLVGLAPEALREEVAGSKARLEAFFGQAVGSFCYPYSAIDPTVRQAVVDAGYTNAVAISVRSRSVTADRFLMKRVYVKGAEGQAAFRRKVSPWYLAYRSLRRR